jgi:hypothetical protein
MAAVRILRGAPIRIPAGNENHCDGRARRAIEPGAFPGSAAEAWHDVEGTACDA